jgi:hypothetical protein
MQQNMPAFNTKGIEMAHPMAELGLNLPMANKKLRPMMKNPALPHPAITKTLIRSAKISAYIAAKHPEIDAGVNAKLKKPALMERLDEYAVSGMSLIAAQFWRLLETTKKN